jgi:lipopolysaccharide/colanic/teichoic acid biosynthesis glycosyltransferase
MGTGFITTKNDPRVLPVGRILRKTKLNELPQIFNIFLGDMSIVGPRPQVPKHFEIYSGDVKSELKKIRPGLTGIGSIFFRDEEKILEKNKHLSYEECYNNVIAPYKGRLELWYVKHRSIGLYLALIFVTAWVVFFPESKLHLKLFKSLPEPPRELVFA